MELMTPFEFLVLGTLWFGMGVYMITNDMPHAPAIIPASVCFTMALIAWVF